MMRMKSGILIFVLIITVVFLSGQGGYINIKATEHLTEINATVNQQIQIAQQENLQGEALAARNNNFELYICTSGNNIGEFKIKDISSGFVWYSNPQDRDQDTNSKGSPKFEMYSQLVLYGYDLNSNTERTINSYIGTKKGANVKYYPINNGFKVVYNFIDDGITIPLYVILENDGVKVRTNTKEIKETSSFRLLKIALVPYMGSGGIDDKGYLFVPDGSGAIINFNNGKTNTDNFSMQIYGDDLSLAAEMKLRQTQQIRMPVYGINRNNQGLLGIIFCGDSNASIEAFVSGIRNSQNNVYANFTVRLKDNVVIGESAIIQVKEIPQYDYKHFATQDCAVTFYPLKQGEYTYSSMANKYKLILKQSGVGSKTALKKTLPFYTEVYGGVYKKESFFGFFVNSYKKLTTFDNALKMVNDLKSAGINEPVLIYKNWSSDEAKFKIQNAVRPSGSLGGMSGFNKLSKELGNDFYPNFSPIDVKVAGNGYSKFFDSSKRLSKEPVLNYDYKLSTHYKDQTVPPSFLPNIPTLKSVTAKYKTSLQNTNCMSIYLSDFGSLLYTNFDQKNYSNRQMFIDAFDVAAKAFNGNTLIYEPNAYSLKYASKVVAVPSDSSKFDIEDETVPFYEIAISGLIDYSLSAVNLSADPLQKIMKTAETGSVLYFVWIYNDTTILKDTNLNYLYGSSYERWKSEALAAQKELENLYNKTGSRIVVNHERLADNVYKTAYQGGHSAIFNYNSAQVETKYGTIKASSYLII